MDKLEVIEALERERQELAAKIASIDMTIITLRQSLNIPDNGGVNGNGNVRGMYKGYKDATSNKKRVIIILKQQAKFLHMRQIVKIAQELDPREDPDVVRKQISQAVYALKGEQLTNITVNDNKANTFWGARNWLKDETTPKPEYMYDKAELAENQTEAIDL